jgi:hypothetical protein
VFLGTFDFDGDPAALLSGYQQLMAQYPPGALLLHLCVIREGGLTVYDACPSRADFEAFSQGGQFAALVASAGLPPPRVTARGEVHRADLARAVRP